MASTAADLGGTPEAVIDGNTTSSARQGLSSSARVPFTVEARCWTLPRSRTSMNALTAVVSAAEIEAISS